MHKKKFVVCFILEEEVTKYIFNKNHIVQIQTNSLDLTKFPQPHLPSSFSLRCKSEDDALTSSTCDQPGEALLFPLSSSLWWKHSLLSKPVVPSSQSRSQSLHRGHNDAAPLTRSSQM